MTGAGDRSQSVRSFPSQVALVRNKRLTDTFQTIQQIC